MKLYPRLRLASAQQLAEERAAMPFEELLGCAGPAHPESFFAPTGGERVTRSHLEMLRSGLEEIAERSHRSQANFDFEVATFLLGEMDISPVESARPEVWAWFALTLVPHLVHRRFADGSGRVNRDRFLAGPFGGRNAFGRLWWRAYLLKDGNGEDSYHLLRELGEDQFVQILERPRLSGYRPLALAIAGEWLDRVRRDQIRVPAEALMRDAMKRVRRLSAFIAWEILKDGEVRQIVADVFNRSEHALATHGLDEVSAGEQEQREMRIARPMSGEFTPLPADLRVADQLQQWVDGSRLTEPKRSFILDFARGLTTGAVPRLHGYRGLKQGSRYAEGITTDLAERGVRPELIQRCLQ